jgi:hypothetical protein
LRIVQTFDPQKQLDHQGEEDLVVEADGNDIW